MPDTTGAAIIAIEEQLRLAMLRADLAALDALLSPELIFTNHLGQLLGKEDDLAAWHSGRLHIESLQPSEHKVSLAGNVAVVSVRMRVVGVYDGHPANGDFRFTRVWALSPENTWQVIAAHSTALA